MSNWSLNDDEIEMVAASCGRPQFSLRGLLILLVLVSVVLGAIVNIVPLLPEFRASHPPNRGRGC